MPRKILFTPVGGTDPIPNKNDYDGPILHICRHYDITDVYMYMSKEILAKHNEDNRYLFCLGKLSEKTGRKITAHLIERPNLVEVQDFNVFYDDFRIEVEKIMKDMGEGDELYFNVSSGTPAMKSCVYVLATMLDYPASLVQVSTPQKRMNEHSHEKEYEKDFWKDRWELNKDNEEDSVNRCAPAKVLSLSTIKNEETLKKLVRECDYHAAVVMAEDMPASATARYLRYLKFAEARKGLDRNIANNYQELAVRFIPERQGDKMKLVEYALELDLKRRRGEYADFLRAITPLFAELLIGVLKSTFNIDIGDYCGQEDAGWSWDCERLQGTKVLSILNRAGIIIDGKRFVISNHLVALIDAKAGNREDVKDLKKNIDDIRGVEAVVRNLVAHQVVGISDDEIRQKTGFRSTDIIRKIKSLFPYAGITLQKDTWNSYDTLNNEILRFIGAPPQE